PGISRGLWWIRQHPRFVRWLFDRTSPRWPARTAAAVKHDRWICVFSYDERYDVVHAVASSLRERVLQTHSIPSSRRSLEKERLLNNPKIRRPSWVPLVRSASR